MCRDLRLSLGVRIFCLYLSPSLSLLLSDFISQGTSFSVMLGVSLRNCLYCFNHLVYLSRSRSAIFLSIPASLLLRVHLGISVLPVEGLPIYHSPCLFCLTLFLGLSPQPHGCLCLSKDPANLGRPHRPGRKGEERALQVLVTAGTNAWEAAYCAQGWWPGWTCSQS